MRKVMHHIYRNHKNKGEQTSTAIKRTTLYYVKRVIFNSFLLTALCLVLQVLVILFMSIVLNQYSKLFLEASTLIGTIFILLIVTGDDTQESKLASALITALFPLAGILIYMEYNYDYSAEQSKKAVNGMIAKTAKYLVSDEEIDKRMQSEHSDIVRLSRYMEQKGSCALYCHSHMEYYSLGDYVFDPLLEDLKAAKEFIFLEFFLIEEGKFWDSVLEVLKEKAAEGVEVRLIYDDLGCVPLLPRNYYKKLEKAGIKVHIFSRLTPVFTMQYNNRDHRKIVVIDGRVAYTGGFNLCDEYINQCEKFGHWKDNGVRVTGNAVRQFTLMFLQMWNAARFNMGVENEYFDRFMKQYPVESDGMIIPYGDGPHRKEPLAKYVYKDILNAATNYVWISSPYLILDDSMETAIKHAAQSGVDVRILLPHIPDKVIPYMIARSHYPALLKAGVKVYEYEPGFVHAKTWISDDRIATVGSVNLDYRSLFLHYEIGCLFYKCEGIRDIKKDFEKTFATSTIRVDMQYYKKLPVLYRAAGRILRVFGPMM